MTTNGVTRALRTAGVSVGRTGVVSVAHGRDDDHVRVTLRPGSDTRYTADVLRINGYTVEPGIAPWMLVISR